MLEQQQLVADPPVGARGGEPLLQLPGASYAIRPSQRTSRPPETTPEVPASTGAISVASTAAR